VSTKLYNGSKVFINPDVRDSWGIRVFESGWAEECRRRDNEVGSSTVDAGEPRLYSDVRMYDPAVDGDGLITVDAVRGKASYLTVRGVFHAPNALVQGVTPTGKTCWFRSTDVIAVAVD
jgi:hypothetical protein